jgi:hypothetical protein
VVTLVSITQKFAKTPFETGYLDVSSAAWPPADPGDTVSASGNCSPSRAGGRLGRGTARIAARREGGRDSVSIETRTIVG